MEKDKIFYTLIRESGIHQAPEDFTAKVMAKLENVPIPVKYKPLIGRLGQIMIFLFISSLVALTLVFGNQGEQEGVLYKWISGLNFEMPAIDINFSLSMLAILGAVFILVLFDSRIHRKNFSF
jgi:hypothetical protein